MIRALFLAVALAAAPLALAAEPPSAEMPTADNAVFTTDFLKQLPEKADGERQAVGAFSVAIPSSFELAAEPAGDENMAGLRLKHSSGIHLDLLLFKKPFKDANDSLAVLRSLARVDAKDGDPALALMKIDDKGFMAHGPINGVTIDAMVWWPGDYMVFVKVFDAPADAEARGALAKDLGLVAKGAVQP